MMIPQSALSFNVLHFSYIRFYTSTQKAVADGWQCHQFKKYIALLL
nr:MAG TPA: hypothetical protein [Caudoviricetes sp.]